MSNVTLFIRVIFLTSMHVSTQVLCFYSVECITASLILVSKDDWSFKCRIYDRSPHQLLKIFHDRQILLYLVELPGRGLTTE